MKKNDFFYTFILIISSLFVLSCSDDDNDDNGGGGGGDKNAVAITGNVSQKGVTWAELSGTITDAEGNGVTAYGVEYKIKGSDETKTLVAGPLTDGNFKVIISGLIPKTEYQYRAYAKVKDSDTKYGSYKNFVTNDFSNIVSEAKATVEPSGVTFNGTVEKSKFEAENYTVGFALAESKDAIKQGGKDFKVYNIKPDFKGGTTADLKLALALSSFKETINYFAPYTKLGDTYKFGKVESFSLEGEDTYVKDGITYAIKSETDKTAKVKNFDKTVVDAVFLSSVVLKNANYKVVEIGEKAKGDYGNSTLKTVKIPNTVKEISKNAFKSCTSLTEVDLGGGVETIGEAAFAECNNLKVVKSTGSLKKIGEQAFFVCKSLESFTLPSAITVLEDYVFGECLSLSSLTIQGKLTKIGHRSFYKTKLKTFSITSSVTELGSYAFEDCTELTKVTIDAKLPQIPTGLFKGCEKLRDVVIPSTVTRICSYAFQGIDGWYTDRITKNINGYNYKFNLVIPDAVEYIETKAFYDVKSASQNPGLNLSLGESTKCKLKVINGDSFGRRPSFQQWACWADNPPTVTGNIEFVPDYTNFPLFVTTASYSKYSSDSYWRQFEGLTGGLK